MVSRIKKKSGMGRGGDEDENNIKLWLPHCPICSVISSRGMLAITNQKVNMDEIQHHIQCIFLTMRQFMSTGPFELFYVRLRTTILKDEKNSYLRENERNKT